MVVQAVHLVAEEQVLHEPGQATQPLVVSKYWPAGQSIGFKTNC